MTQKDQTWPSFIIQGVILGTNVYLISHAGLANIWTFLSILCLLSLFSLQAITTKFLFLYPINIPRRTDASSWHTHVLRIFIILSALFLYIALQQKYPEITKWWFLAIGVLFIFILPMAFNFCQNKQKLNNKLFQEDQALFSFSYNDGNKRGTVSIAPTKLIWVAEKKHEISWDDLISKLEGN